MAISSFPLAANWTNIYLSNRRLFFQLFRSTMISTLPNATGCGGAGPVKLQDTIRLLTKPDLNLNVQRDPCVEERVCETIRLSCFIVNCRVWPDAVLQCERHSGDQRRWRSELIRSSWYHADCPAHRVSEHHWELITPFHFLRGQRVRGGEEGVELMLGIKM